MKRVLIYALAAFALSSFMVSCDKEEKTPDPQALGAPKLSLADTTATSVTVKWDAVENAASYEVMLDNDETNLIPVTGTEYELATPEEGTYTVKVRALPAEGENYLTSEWSEPIEYELKGEEPEPDEPTKLDTPEAGIGETTDAYFVVLWDAVANAASYEYTVNDGEAQSVTETSVQIETPEAGTYTVRVRALPAEDSEEYLASDWSEPVTRELEEVIEKTKLATPEVYISQADGQILCRLASEVENADTYEYKVDDGEIVPFDTFAGMMLMFTLYESDYTPGDHTVHVRALPVEGSEEFEASDWSSDTFTIEGGGGTVDPNDYMSWVGTWEVTTTQSMVWGNDPVNEGYVIPMYENIPMTFDVEITYDSEYEELNITGWSPVENVFEQSLPLFASIDETTGSMQIWNGIAVGMLSETEYLMWLASDTDCQIISLDMFGVFTLTLSADGQTITGTPNTVEFSTSTGGSQAITMNAIDLYSYDQTSGGIGVYTVGMSSPAGSFTMTKKSSAAPAYAPAFDANKVLNQRPVYRTNYVLK